MAATAHAGSCHLAAAKWPQPTYTPSQSRLAAAAAAVLPSSCHCRRCPSPREQHADIKALATQLLHQYTAAAQPPPLQPNFRHHHHAAANAATLPPTPPPCCHSRRAAKAAAHPAMLPPPLLHCCQAATAAVLPSSCHHCHHCHHHCTVAPVQLPPPLHCC